MPASAAFEEFLDVLALAEALVGLEATFSDPPVAPDDRLCLGLRGGSSVLVVAAFENFLHGSFEERLAELTRQPPVVAFRKLPEKLRVTSVFAGIDRAMRGDPGTKSQRVDRLPAVLHAARLAGAEIVNPSAFSDTRSNPGAAVVRRLFNDVGCDDVFTRARPIFDGYWGKPEATTFLEDKLEEIVSRRNSVAHTADVRRITRQELAEAPAFLTALSVSLDEVLEAHVQHLMSTCPP